MRTLGFRTHLLLAIAGAASLVLTLGRPWYAPAPAPALAASGDIGDLSGPLNSFFAGLQRWLTEPQGDTGWHALDQTAIALAAMAGVPALGALAWLAPPLQAIGRDLLRYGALAAFAIAAWKLFDPPGPNEAVELRRGALAAAGCALVLLTCAIGAANAPLRRKSVQRSFQPPPAPARSPHEMAGSIPPPGRAVVPSFARRPRPAGGPAGPGGSR